jgi:delta1-piperideine-2-carboxylate reductase
MSDINMTIKQAYDLTFSCLRQNGCNEENAAAAAFRLTQAEADMCQAHGLFRLPWYVGGVKSGRVNGSSKPSVKRLAAAVVKVDGDGGFAPLAQQVAHSPLADCARENGIAVLALTNMFHIAAMWPEVEALAEDGLCGIAVTASYPYVAPAGGLRALFGTNPMGFSWPRPDGPPMVFDQASSAIARGEIQIAARDGRQVPFSAGIGPEGQSTTDPEVVLQGAQLGFGGYKGASLAMMVELLAGPLIGEFLSFEAEADDAGLGGPPKGGELMIAIDPARFGDAKEIIAHGETLFQEVLKQEGTRLPGDRRFQSREITRHKGINIPASLYEEIVSLRG